MNNFQSGDFPHMECGLQVSQRGDDVDCLPIEFVIYKDSTEPEPEDRYDPILKIWFYFSMIWKLFCKSVT